MALTNTDHIDVLRAALEEHELQCAVDEILDAACSAIYFTATTATDDASHAGSFLGGNPDRATDSEWPRIDGHCLNFVAQINLADLPPRNDPQLPLQGLLQIFQAELSPTKSVLQGNDGTVIVVEYLAPPLTELQRTPAPDDVKETYPCALLEFEDGVSLPQFNADLYYELEEWAGQHCDVSEDYFEEHYSDICTDVVPLDEDGEEVGVMLGYEKTYEGDGAYDAVQAEHAQRGSHIAEDDIDADDLDAWTLLIEIGSHNAADMAWGDMGLLQVFITHDDVAAGRFDRVFGRVTST